ncbi:GGDEF domain-containing protein [Acetobacterium tundrae]|uniref:Diguanylate cyclase n=1 Tax=Acetobacterium tundrae TaxID=132932 RepID=A0ABR6WQ45_9FIRM|nr:GGDEF domain-containing protein [Acetobacterium tundrae]MBC3798571.1 diguanylate cyclase [Acetobacterium tundrae]
MENKNNLLHKIIQIISVVLMLFLLINIFNMIFLIRETGDVINISDNIRSEIQRLVKLELYGDPQNDMIDTIDKLINDFEYDKTRYEWEKQQDPATLEKLNLLPEIWRKLRTDLINYRLNASNKEPLLQSSEAYFKTINYVVEATENYSAERIKELITNEVALAILIFVLIVASVPQSTKEIQLIRKNRELEVAAYIDKITGLPGRRSCEEKIWMPMNPKKAPYCVAIFDLNNLKKMNDLYGHHEGDRLIKGFACILGNISNDRIFAGRYGGDEFIIIVHGYNKEKIIRLLYKIELQVNDHNKENDHPQIQYAVGYSFEGETLRAMIDIADERMYVNKKNMKEKAKSLVLKIDCQQTSNVHYN